jgi:sirohydrochlorin cobaltochelatase
MPDAIEEALSAALRNGTSIGEILIQCTSNGGFILCHRDDQANGKLRSFHKTEDAIEVAKFDDGGNYRPLKTAPNLAHGWRLEVLNLGELRQVLDYFYPGRLAMLAAWQDKRLATTPLRDTLDRQSGMYRVASKISDEQIDDLVGNFCRSSGGCLRTILWKRDTTGSVASSKLPAEKFDRAYDQTGNGESAIPLLCQEACGLLVAACRKVVKGEANE